MKLRNSPFLNMPTAFISQVVRESGRVLLTDIWPGLKTHKTQKHKLTSVIKSSVLIRI